MFEMVWWQIAAAIRGYNERSHATWETTRWQSWIIVSALGAKINSPKELVSFPWEKEDEHDDQPTAEDIERLQREMKEYNDSLAPR